MLLGESVIPLLFNLCGDKNQIAFVIGGDKGLFEKVADSPFKGFFADSKKVLNTFRT